MTFKLIKKPVNKSSLAPNEIKSCVDESSKYWACMMCGTSNVFESRYCANPTCSFDRAWGS